MRKTAIAIATYSAAMLASAPVSAAVGEMKQDLAATNPQQHLVVQAGLVDRPANQPAATNLAKTCSDPWWQMSGIQALTCLYMAAR